MVVSDDRKQNTASALETLFTAAAVAGDDLVSGA